MRTARGLGIWTILACICSWKCCAAESLHTREVYTDDNVLRCRYQYLTEDGEEVREGKTIIYKPDGTLQKVEYYQDGEKVGPCYLFPGYGVVMMYYEGGQPTGIVLEWNADGELVRIEAPASGEECIAVTSAGDGIYGIAEIDQETCKPVEGVYRFGGYEFTVHDRVSTEIKETDTGRAVSEKQALEGFGLSSVDDPERFKAEDFGQFRFALPCGGDHLRPQTGNSTNTSHHDSDDRRPETASSIP